MSQMSLPEAEPGDPQGDSSELPFPREAGAVMRRLRLAIMRLFDAAHGGVRKSNDAQKLFGVNAKLSWQIFKLIGPGDIFTFAPHIPSAPSMRRLLDAAAERGVPAPAIDEVRQAYEAFEDLVIRHAGDRTSFDSMTRGLAEGGEESQRADIQHRRALFQGHSHYWGAQVDTHALAMFIHEGSKPGHHDYAQIRSKLGMRRLRSDADVLVDMAHMTHAGEYTFHGETFDLDAAKKYGAAIIPEFCTQPLPAFATAKKADGSTWTKLSGDLLGRRGTVDLVFGLYWRDVPLTPSPDNKSLGFGTGVVIPYPTGNLVIDVFVHRAAFPSVQEHFGIYGPTSPKDDAIMVTQNQPKLPFRETLTRLGNAADHVHLRDMPTYVDVINRACDHLKWQLQDFDLYRVHIQYPIFGTLASIWFDAVPNEPGRGESE